MSFHGDRPAPVDRIAARDGSLQPVFERRRLEPIDPVGRDVGVAEGERHLEAAARTLAPAPSREPTDRTR